MWWKKSWSTTHVAFKLGVMGKSKLKGRNFGFLENGMNCAQVFVSKLSEISRPMLWIWVRREPCFEIYSGFWTWKQILIFLFNVCDINFQTCEKSTPISRMYNTYVKLLKLLEVVLLLYIRGMGMNSDVPDKWFLWWLLSRWRMEWVANIQVAQCCWSLVFSRPFKM